MRFFLKKVILFYIGFLVCSSSYSQNTLEKITILKQKIAQENVVIDSAVSAQISIFLPDLILQKEWDTALFFTNALGNYYTYKIINHVKAYQILDDFSMHLTKCTNTKEIAAFYIAYAEAATYTKRLEKSLEILDKSFVFFNKLQDSTLYEYGYAYLKAGENASKLNMMSESVAYFEKAKDIFKSQKDTLNLLWANNGLSTLYGRNGLYEKAAEERIPIYNLGSLIKEHQVVSMAHLQAVIDAMKLNEPDKQLHHIRKALSLKNENADVQEIINILTTSFAVMIYAQEKKIDSSNLYARQLLPYVAKAENNPFISTYSKQAFAYNALANRRYKEAQKIGSNVLNSSYATKDFNNVIRTHLFLATVFEKQRKIDSSLYHHKIYSRLNDSLQIEISKRKFAFVQTQFDTEKKDLALAEKEKDIQFLSQENKLKSQQLIFGILSVLILSFSIYMLRTSRFNKKKLQLHKTFAANLVDNLETERKRIATDLHDNIGQNLLLLKKSYHYTAAKNNETLHLINETINEIRNVSSKLHPFQFEQLGFIKSLENMMDGFQKNSTVFYSYTIDAISGILPKEKELLIFRMLQEAITNVEKHAHATACNLTITKEAKIIRFVLKDNGRGFFVGHALESSRSLGLKSLRERAQYLNAILNITSQPATGTTITIKIKKQ
ncbi:sensor histidine kinase [uncultured Polaribacter sp.]|uniref:ATP-binding protein n=1 Tax=uncultured Polaribacter sp. TaxID=174711 RepID=UPI002630FDDB|nr:sensor histidine kinase [uncultured Polaribacter sp.]